MTTDAARCGAKHPAHPFDPCNEPQGHAGPHLAGSLIWPLPPLSRERPILFSGSLVRAILSGAKTQTRRPAKLFGIGHTYPQPDGTVKVERVAAGCGAGWEVLENPFGRVGDRLWVRETWAAHWMYDDTPPTQARSGLPDDNRWYAADGDDAPGSHGCPAKGRRGKWRPSIHMPRWASRLTLEVTGVRLERVQAISEDDARAEGYGVVFGPGMFSRSFQSFWDEVYGEGSPVSWAENPWVWVVEFKLIEGER